MAVRPGTAWNVKDRGVKRILPALRRLLSVDIAITAGFLAVGVVVLLQARGWPFRAGLFPLAASSLLLGLALLKLVLDVAIPGHPATTILRQGSAEEEKAAETDLIDVFFTASRADWLSALGWMAAFFVMLWLLGSLVAVPLFALIYLLLVSRESMLLAGSYALVSWAFVYWLFDRLLHVPLPSGALLTRLGL